MQLSITPSLDEEMGYIGMQSVYLSALWISFKFKFKYTVIWKCIVQSAITMRYIALADSQHQSINN